MCLYIVDCNAQSGYGYSCVRASMSCVCRKGRVGKCLRDPLTMARHHLSHRPYSKVGA